MSETERVTLVGNLTADPELRSTPSGLEVANLRIAVTPRTRQEDGSWTDQDGTEHQVTEIDAEEVGPSLRWATAKVTRTNGRKASGQ